MTIRILLADDQEAVRVGFRLVLDSQPDMEVVGEASDGLQAVELAAALNPDVVLADIRMPRMDGLEVTRRLAGLDATSPMRVVVVTTFELDEYVHTALSYGACGFLLKRSGPTLLVEATRAAMAGDTLISPSLTVNLLKHHRNAGRPKAPKPVDALTNRETEIAVLVAKGMTNAQIGSELLISAGTAKTHVASIQRKLDVRNRVGIAAWVWGHGLEE
ncbi:DNA-binding response regulator [Paractinoplanes abujensis]|uniref:DNA-binding NarL/FixJ family response regulator n=1 Tax=Paractinoplanes abujensis TaxID=882441 RepID=A0A7W7CX85_9ACTN|nr:response regulator transcription factor [Actinoplanes abujensis]MBB4694953.1 DNA-binding NarL/FixJ family response regulator [Actinoplanes abujensis]GID23683.1 DNA-binding response regulator [Actinoplanes abujensis]